MKKIYLSAAAILAGTIMSAQAFWTPTTYKGAFPVTDGTPATNWASGWSNFDPENTVYATPTQTVSADITSNTTWSGVVLLQNKVYVKNNAVLTIQPGTVIRGDKATQGTLIITKGAQINAAGTASQPIVFTSNEAVGNRQEGDWGGLVVLGLAVNNQPGGTANIEGITPIPETAYGGTNDADNSGTLTYIRIEFAGIPLQPNKEINGLTLGSVGSATTVRYIQVSFSGDDSFEWFGGTVDAKYLIAYRGLDDDFDCDFGFRGRVQFAVSIRDKDLSDAAGDSNSFEVDNDGTGSTATPQTKAVFSNVTLIGPKGDGTIVLPGGEKFEKAFRLRRNSALSVFNSLVTGWEKGLSIEDPSTQTNYGSGNGTISNVILTNFATATKIVTSGNPYNAALFGTNGNDTTTTIAQINWVNAFPALGVTPDLRLSAASTASTGAAFTNSVFAGQVTGINNITNFNDKVVSVYPNPANESALLVIDAVNASSINVAIYDVTGKLVSSPVINQNLSIGENSYTLNTANLNSGVYFISINTNGTKQTVKLVVSK
ncbi:MAG: T9SS type A sorting domain-containing protein [Bacteroidota bacterium]|nr:T9SS type A sorting domain-containing protein [Bacteroidota bacterium]